MGFQCHKMKLLWKFFVRASFPFWFLESFCLKKFTFKTKQTNKILNFQPLACWKEIHQFFHADLETTIQFLPKVFVVLQCHKMKLLWKFLVQAICLLDKTNQKNWIFLIKPNISFCSSCTAVSSVMKHNSSVLFYLKHDILSRKGSHQSGNSGILIAQFKLHNFSCHFKSLKVCTSMASICLKYIRFELKILKSFISWHWSVMQNLNESWLVAFKMAWWIGWTFTRTLKNLKDCTSMGSLCAKYVWPN